MNQEFTVPIESAVLPSSLAIRPRAMISNMTRGELLTLLAVAVFAESMTVTWIATVLELQSGIAAWKQALGLAAVDLASLVWLPLPLFFLYDRFPPSGPRRTRNAIISALGALGVLPVSALVSTEACRLAGEAFGLSKRDLEFIAPGYPEQLFWAWCAVLGTSLAYFILRRLHEARELEHRNAELQRLALEARLSVLAAELRPHFLFNALNDLAELVHHDPERAEAMLLHLSSLLQTSLTSVRRRTISLAEELRYVDDYLAVQQMRFEDRLQVVRDVDPDTLAAQIPPMLLQPLVENAVVHGVEGRMGASQVEVRIRYTDAHLEVQVNDNGPGPGGSAHQGTGTGLRNVRARLAALYGDRASATLHERAGGGTSAIVRLPAAAA